MADQPSAQASPDHPMDGVSPPAAAPAPAAPAAAKGPIPPAELTLMKRKVAVAASAVYGAYLLLCFGLSSLLPSPSGELNWLVPIGLLICLAGGVAIAGAFFLMFKRIAQSKAPSAVKQRSLIKAAVIAAPGILFSMMVAFLITREPSLAMMIIQPTRTEDFVAPVAVTFSVEEASNVLRRLGKRPVKYVWDTDGDGKSNEETVTPTLTYLVERPGAYVIVCRIMLDDQSFRRASRRLTIPQAVFSVTPPAPVVEKPIRFSIEHLLTVKPGEDFGTVTWDYGDGTNPEKLDTMETLHTYYAVGEYEVSALIQLPNNTQATFKRTVVVTEPPPLPFPVTLTTEPSNLIGPPPFGALFEIKTDEPVKEVYWQFGDEKEERGATLFRVGHSYERPGIYPVVTRVRSASGSLAELTTIVRVNELLAVPDLSFQGQPAMGPGYALEGEAPLQVKLTPKTGVPLVSFLWEPGDEFVTVDGSTVDGVYREPGTYSLVLIAQSAEGKVMRQNITVRVRPPSAQPTILVKPDGGVAPLQVMFDASQSFIPEGETVAGFKWSFGDERFGTGRGTEELGPARVQHTYENPGDYTVVLKILLSSGKEFTAQRKIVVRRPTLRACLTASRIRVTAGRGVEFDSSCSAGSPNSLMWDVRYAPQPDAVIAQSDQAQYIHVFETPGEYTVTLTVKDQWQNVDSKSVTITVTP